MLLDGFDVSGFVKKDGLYIFNLDLSNILNKNIVKNFICKMDFEIGFMEYSETANCIAEFYNNCLQRGNIFEFFNNETVKTIKEEMQNIPRLKIYLNERFFDEIEKDKIRFLNNIYTNNDKILSDVDKLKKEWVEEEKIKQDKLDCITSLNQNDVDKIKEILNQMANDIKQQCEIDNYNIEIKYDE